MECPLLYTASQQEIQHLILAMYLVVARLLSMSITFCLLLTSNMCCQYKQ